MPEITTITSESLQAEVRRLLPSQRGFGGDLEAQNVIVPVVDLTPTAEGSALREDLQTAISYGAMTTSLRFTTGTNVVLNSPGFYKYTATLGLLSGFAAANNTANTLIREGGSFRVIDQIVNNADASGEEPSHIAVTQTIFLKTGQTFEISTSNDAYIHVAVWPVADVNGNFINPDGFSFE